ncbi:hypothetical protein H6P81_005184 [Aristolochia fimbriata]|uniref:Uncharacterized protein n=1 Tax=Aristolochia fimbriata TaxID=158543 RepID=A0AAV7ETQ4_ARIFI|nr:hypothetical protein H6P81_005184 [Aristolochia fimbriata]
MSAKLVEPGLEVPRHGTTVKCEEMQLLFRYFPAEEYCRFHRVKCLSLSITIAEAILLFSYNVIRFIKLDILIYIPCLSRFSHKSNCPLRSVKELSPSLDDDKN